MKYYLIAGEASGDLHASNLMQGLLESDPNAQFRFFGGDLMAQKGGILVKHYREMAFMGFLEVVMNLRTISKNINLCKQDIINYQPDIVILVDYPGFNLRIAKFAKLTGFRVFYYIAPKVWAWRESRVKILKKYVDKLFVIFPFEVDYFKKHGIDVIFEGNPLKDAISDTSNKVSFSDFIIKNNLSDKPIIAILSGSRKQEIRYNLPVMLSLEKQLYEYQLVIAGAPSLTLNDYAPYLTNSGAVLVFNQTHDLLRNATVAVVTSGTATLEAALLNIPEVVCYRGNIISMFIAWLVIRVKYISLVNLIMGNEVVRELKQFDLNPNQILREVKDLLPQQVKRELMINRFRELNDVIGLPGSSSRVAKHMVKIASQKN